MQAGRLSISFVVSLLCLSSMQAQWDASFASHWAAREYYNPSFAGETARIRTFAAYRHSWTGIKNAPSDVVATVDMPFEFLARRHGAGIVLHTQRLEQLQNTFLAGQYAFRKNTKHGSFAAGIQAGIHRLGYDAGNITLVSDAEESPKRVRANTVSEKNVFDVNAGISWCGKHFHLGISALHLSQPRFYVQPDNVSDSNIRSDSLRSRIRRTYNFQAAYNIALFKPLEIQPMIWALTDLSSTHMQATLRLVYDKVYSGGASWIANGGYVFFAAAAIQGVEAGYAYTRYTSGIGKNSNGSHEVYLRYIFPFEFFAPRRQPHKSIRLL